MTRHWEITWMIGSLSEVWPKGGGGEGGRSGEGGGGGGGEGGEG